MADAATPAPEIVGVRPAVTGIYLTLRCQGCGAHFESYQATVLCIPVGELACPACAAPCAVSTVDFDAAVERYLPYQTPDEMKRLTAEATRVAESWHRHPAFASILRYRGVDLGAPMERELLATITLGLAQASDGAVPEEAGADGEERR